MMKKEEEKKLKNIIIKFQEWWSTSEFDSLLLITFNWTVKLEYKIQLLEFINS